METPTRTGPDAGGRCGKTLIEVLLTTLVFGTVLAGTLSFLEVQNRAFSQGSDRMSALQNLGHTMDALETDLETLGTNLAADQPGMVLAGEGVVAFNADYASNVRNDVSAVFRDLDADDDEVLATGDTVRMPNTPGYTYRPPKYRSTGGRAPAETLTLYLAADTATTRRDDYVLLRRINDLESEVVTRNLLRVPGHPFLRYYARRQLPGRPSVVVPIPDSVLPIAHDDPRADSIRAVRVTVAATNGGAGASERTVRMSRMIRLPNAGLDRERTCGDVPVFGTSVSAEATSTGDGGPAVDLAWDASPDEVGGEGDVVRYVLWRRASGGEWGAPLLSIPAGRTGYVYRDAEVEPGETYEYRVAAQDCTPALSSGSVSGEVTLP